MKNIMAVVKMNGGIWLNIFPILSFNKVSIVVKLLLSFLSAVEVGEDWVAVESRDIFARVPLAGELGGEEIGVDWEVIVKTCNNLIKIFNNGIW